MKDVILYRRVIIIAIVSIIIIGALVASRSMRVPVRSQIDELLDPNITQKVSRIEFAGQRRVVAVQSQSQIALLIQALKQTSSRAAQGGLAYDLHIRLASDQSIKVKAFIYDSLDGFALAMPERSFFKDPLGAKDPVYRDILISSNAQKELREIFETLISAEPRQSTKAF